MAKRNKYNEEFGAGAFNPMPPSQTPCNSNSFDPFSVPTSTNLSTPDFYSNQVMDPFANNRSFQNKRGLRLPNLFRGNLPWGKIGIVFGAIAAIVLMIVFRKEITSFLVDLLTWVAIAAVLYFIIRRFLFRRR